MSDIVRIKKFLEICTEADQTGLLVAPPADILSGFSGNCLVGALQRFGRYFAGSRRAAYVEIGVFQGLTLLANGFANPDLPCIGIDNFSLFNESGENKRIVLDRMSLLGVRNARILDMDFEEGLTKLETELPAGIQVGVYFVDGAHDYRSQLVSLLRIKPYLAEDGVILIDDANYPHVRQATVDFLESEPDFKLLCEAYTPAHPANLSKEAEFQVRAGWWNGVNILTRDPEGVLPRRLPSLTPGARDLHFLTHDLFRHRYSDLAVEIIRRTARLIGDGPDAEAAREEVLHLVTRHRSQHGDRFDHQNTYSAGFPRFAVNEPGSLE